MNECIYCKSTDVKTDVLISSIISNPESSIMRTVGPSYDTGRGNYVCGVEPMFADICKQCGGVKLYIKNTERNWEFEKNIFDQTTLKNIKLPH